MPGDTLVTLIMYRSVPERWFTIITSFTLTVLLVTVNDCQDDDPAFDTKVIEPVGVFMVTPVVLLVSCVTVPPDPVE